MNPVKAVTHHHWKFLKEAYKMNDSVDLVNDERYLKVGDRYIKFDIDCKAFTVYIMAVDRPLKVRTFDTLTGAVNCARRV